MTVSQACPVQHRSSPGCANCTHEFSLLKTILIDEQGEIERYLCPVDSIFTIFYPCGESFNQTGVINTRQVAHAGVDMMSYVGPLPPLQAKKEPAWNRYVGDSILALGATLLLTAIISLFHLYQRIPDSFLVYLLLILVFANKRSLYAALLTSFAAFFFYDFLFVPPAYSLFVTKFEDILALVVFLVTAIMTAQLASDLRRQADEANRRERETSILYNLVRATNREEDLVHQLQIFARAVVDVFSPWGIRNCMLLLPDAIGKLVPQSNTPDLIDAAILSPEEEALAARVMKQAQTMDLRASPQEITGGNVPVRKAMKKASGVAVASRHVRFVPLKTDHRAIGVLRLLIEVDPRRSPSENALGVTQDTRQAVFFSTFLEHDYRNRARQIAARKCPGEGLTANRRPAGSASLLGIP